MSKESNPNTREKDRRSFLRILGATAGVTTLGDLVGAKGTPPETGSRSSHLVRFGNTDLWVSRLCQGTAFRTHLSQKGDSVEAHNLLRYCIDIGINFFDTAEAYGSGQSEIALGKGVEGRRNEVIIATKAYQNFQGQRGTFSKEILMKKAEGSLKRLGTDYIDLYLLHGPDEKTPSYYDDMPSREVSTKRHMEEIADAMDALVQSGKIRYWGVSNHLPRQVDELIEISNQVSKAPIAGLEDYYTIIAADRRALMVDGLFPLIRKGNLGLMGFSPLGEGRLVPGRKVEDESALMDVVTVLDEVAYELGVTRPQVCVGWVAAHPEVTTVLAGAEKPEHVEENFKGTEVAMPGDVMEKLNSAADAYTARIARETIDSA